ncbi:MAG: succinylglutamate desuccinylase/aspartoacylase family protein [Candidatus Poribacteria bacterium]|nr:succinylglutamate desuccinylase/aspartoacylase family protein [Candidatus Poribacteria bacterium]
MSAMPFAFDSIDSFSPEDSPPGTKIVYRKQITTLIDGREIGFSILVARGQKDGKTLVVCAGIHGDEYEGIVAIQECFRELDPAQIRGTLIAVPIVNEPAFFAHRRESPIDEKNLASVFPGHSDGTVSEQIAYHLTHSILKHGDLFIDLHSAGTYYTLKPWVGYSVKGGRIQQIQREAAIAFGFDLIWGSAFMPGRSISGSYLYEVPTLHVEMRGSGLCRREDVEQLKHGIQRVMSYLKMLKGDFQRTLPPYFRENDQGDEGRLQIEHLSKHDGLFLPHVSLWEHVEAGQRIGCIYSPEGDSLQVVHAEHSGRIVVLRTCPSVVQGDFLVTVIRL